MMVGLPLLPLVLLLLILGGVAAVAVVRLRRAGSSSAGEPGLSRCGSCGYPAEGVGSFECPECGSDLRRVGILPPGVRVRSRLPGLVVLLSLWTAGVMVGGGLLYGVLATTVLPHTATETADVDLASPYSGSTIAWMCGNTRVERSGLGGTGRRWWWSRRSRSSSSATTGAW